VFPRGIVVYWRVGMKRACIALVLASLFSGAAIARADINTSATDSLSNATGPRLPITTPQAPEAGPLSHALATTGNSPWHATDGDNDASQELKSLPPLPSSAGLFISALLGAGAWHVVKNAKNVHLAALPDWYHTGGPGQIAHAVPFDLDFTILPAVIQASAASQDQTVIRFSQEPVPIRLNQFFLVLADPRGPPAIAA